MANNIFEKPKKRTGRRKNIIKFIETMEDAVHEHLKNGRHDYIK